MKTSPTQEESCEPKDDSVLEKCNETELLQILHRQGLGTLRRGLDHNLLVSLAKGEINPDPSYLAGTTWTRGKLEDWLASNWGKTMSQLPGCDGKCRTFQCTEGKHASCFEPNVNQVLL